MSPVPEIQPDSGDKGECSSGSDHTEESVNLQDFVVVPKQISPGSDCPSENPENEDLECYSDAQLRAILDEAVTYKRLSATPSSDHCDFSGSLRRAKEIRAAEINKRPLWLDAPKKPEESPGNPFVPKTNPFRTTNVNVEEQPPKQSGSARRRARKAAAEAENIPVKKEVRKEGNAIVRNSQEIVGFRGNDNIDALLRFIESSDAPAAKKPPRPKSQKKTKKPKKPEPKAKEEEKAPEKPAAREEVRLSSGKTSPSLEAGDFRVVTTKKKKKPKN
ncbi:uncharacterized protein LOC132264963 [Phlebotomus argentipes]|uniref:uncharacterized protein LOC132264963 n=1 Tax=Phlebotomus argentipes TaxID=94469 RepID=UPI00289316A7|nr:uncharacterized protein LOC132264963 [Phlebotomus argentipes]